MARMVAAWPDQGCPESIWMMFLNDRVLVVWNRSFEWLSVGFLIPTVTHSIIFQRGRLKPPTSFGTTFTTRDALAQFLKTVSSPAIGRSYQLSYIHHLRSWDIGRIFILTVLGQTIFLNHPQSPKHRWYLSCLRGTVPWVPRNLMADHHATNMGMGRNQWIYRILGNKHLAKPAILGYLGS